MKSLKVLILSLLMGFSQLLVAAAEADTPGDIRDGMVKPGFEQSRFDAYVDGAVERSMLDTKMPGLIFSAANSDRTLYLQAYGWSHPGKGLRADPDKHPFFIGSITKVFTAVAILQLSEQGLLSLDDDVAQHIDSSLYDSRRGTVTIRHLLTHTAGFEERMTNYYGAIPGIDGLTDAEVLRKIKPEQIRQPGALIGYSNYGWIVLGQVIEAVSGAGYSDYVEANVLRPLGMHKSSMSMAPETPEEADLFKAVRSHSWRGGAYREIDITPQHPVAAPSGLLRSTASDMARFARMMLNGGVLEGVRILGPDAHAQLFEILEENAPETAGRTAGFWTYTIGEHRIFAHTGQHADFRSHLVIIPTLDLALFVSNNSPEGSALRLPRQIVEHFFGMTPLATPVEEVTLINPDRYTGRYLGTRTIESRFERLFWSLGSEVGVSATSEAVVIGDMRYTPVSRDVFQSPYTGEYVRFFGPEGGAATYYSKGFATYQVYQRVDYLRSRASLAQPATITLMLSLITLLALPLQVWNGMQANNKASFGLRTDWLLRGAALAAIVAALAFGVAIQNYSVDASGATKTFPNPTFALSIWAAVVFTVMTLFSVISGLLDFKEGRGTLPGRLIRMATTFVFAITVAALFYWNYIPDPLFL